MTVTEHPDYSRRLAAMKLAVARVRPWLGTIYRSAPPKWSAGRDMLTGIGSMKSGARFNAPGSFPAVYGSTTPELAMIESLAYQRRAGLPVERALPLVFKAIMPRHPVKRAIRLVRVILRAIMLVVLRGRGNRGPRGDDHGSSDNKACSFPGQDSEAGPASAVGGQRHWSAAPTVWGAPGSSGPSAGCFVADGVWCGV